MQGSGRRSALVTIAGASFIFSGVLLHSKDVQQASLPREWSCVHGDGTNERYSTLKENQYRYRQATGWCVGVEEI